MKKLHSAIDETGLTYIVDENNQYYESGIRTARKENYYQVDYANEVTKLTLEKQQLISFLENKIKNSEDNKRNFPNEFSFWIGKLGAYQEVLDFVNKGDKDE